MTAAPILSCRGSPSSHPPNHPTLITNLIANLTDPLLPLDPPYQHPPQLLERLYMRPPTRITPPIPNLHHPHSIFIPCDPICAAYTPLVRLRLGVEVNMYWQVFSDDLIDKLLYGSLGGPGDEPGALDEGGPGVVRRFSVDHVRWYPAVLAVGFGEVVDGDADYVAGGVVSAMQQPLLLINSLRECV